MGRYTSSCIHTLQQYLSTLELSALRTDKSEKSYKSHFPFSWINAINFLDFEHYNVHKILRRAENFIALLFTYFTDSHNSETYIFLLSTI